MARFYLLPLPGTINQTSMKLAILSDLHGNWIALEAVLKDLKQKSPDVVVCLGDIALTGPYPREVLELVQAEGWPTVRGNCDAWLLDPMPYPADSHIEALDYWCHAQLTVEHLSFIETLPQTLRIPIGDTELLCYHGSPHSYHDIVLAQTPECELVPMFPGTAPLMVGGHTHQAMLRRYGNTLLLNPGSVGLPYTGTKDGLLGGEAEYLLLQATPSVHVEFCRVPFSTTKVAEAFRAQGAPDATYWAAEWRKTTEI